MNPRKLMAVALCAAACVSTVAFAEDDFGIESASPVKIADPVNPQPGMIFNAYNYPNWMGKDQLKESNSNLPKTAALKTGVDKGEKFGVEIATGVKPAAIKWDGFLKCKRATTYTFLFQKREYNGFWSGYSVRINGVAVLPATYGEATCDVNLKVGWNKVEIVCQFNDKDPLSISFKPKGSLSDPRTIAPKDLFHDQKPEEDW